MIDIDFEIIKDGHVFRDSIYLPIGHGYTEDQIEAMKQARFKEWLKATEVE